MSRLAVLDLDSVRLAQYAVPAPCYICGGGNNFDAELCRHCQSPMALAHQANSQGIRPRMVATIGSAGAGKSVYLGMLMDLLSRQNDRLQILARGAFSIALQQSVIGALSQCRFPAKTPNEPDRWNWMHCQVKPANWRRPLELIMPDMAGDAILEEIDHPGTFKVIRAFLSQCAGVMVLVDAADLSQGEQTQDYFTMKILSYLCELDGDRKSGWPNRPISLVFTKSDQCDGCFDDPHAFARDHAPGIWQQCQERLQKFNFFAAGVAGACGYRRELNGRIQVPLRVEPRGIIEPFEWLVGQLGKSRK